MTESPGYGPGREPAGQQEHLRGPAAGSANLDFPVGGPLAAVGRPGAGPAEGAGRPGTGHLQCVQCHQNSHMPGTRAGGHDYQPPRRIAEGVGADGRMVVHPGMAGEVTADFPSLRHQGGDLVRPEHDGLEEALQWAQRVLASDPQVTAVTIRQSIQEYDGQMWKAGRHVRTVTRPDATTTTADADSGPGQSGGQGVHADNPPTGPPRAAASRRRARRAGAGPPGTAPPAGMPRR